MKAMLVHQIDRRGVLCSFVFLFSFGSIFESRAGFESWDFLFLYLWWWQTENEESGKPWY